MRNCLILGAGRSGTSMLAGTLSAAGYYMGDILYPGREANPKGFFEDREINDINEELLAPLLPRRPKGRLRHLFRSRPARGQRWLALLPVGTEMSCPAGVAERIASVTSHTPFSFKDPRFSYTLPAWRPFVNDAVFICMFREPARTAHSIVKECKEAKYLRELSMDYSRALKIWTLMYSHILDVHRHTGTWLFVHYDQMLDGSAYSLLESSLECQVDPDFVDPNLKRSSADGDVPTLTREIYGQLCALAGYGNGLSDLYDSDLAKRRL